MAELIAAIIAGGKARRFGGQRKPLLRVDGERIIERQLRVLSGRFDEIVIAANEPEPYAFTGLRVVADRFSGAGPAAGLDAVFAASDASFVFALAGDMPYLNAAVLDLFLTADRNDIDAVAARVAGWFEPLHALYARSCAPVIERRLRSGRYRFSGLLDEENLRVNELSEQDVRALDSHLQFLTNLNSVDDLLQSDRDLTKRID